MKAELIDSMGSDLTVVNAARVSFNKESEWEQDGDSNEQSNRLSVRDVKLIQYLAEHNHWTPFSHVMVTMRETVPIFVARQRFKHVVGFTYNEVSRRYVDDEPEFFMPDKWRMSAENKKQGSGEDASTALDEQCFWWAKELYDLALRYYGDMIDEGIAPEQARMILPQSMYTSYYTTGSLAAWARAYSLRSDVHAQKEIQDLAVQWNEIIGGISELKHSWAALTSMS